MLVPFLCFLTIATASYDRPLVCETCTDITPNMTDDELKALFAGEASSEVSNDTLHTTNITTDVFTTVTPTNLFSTISSTDLLSITPDNQLFVLNKTIIILIIALSCVSFFCLLATVIVLIRFSASIAKACRRQHLWCQRWFRTKKKGTKTLPETTIRKNGSTIGIDSTDREAYMGTAETQL